MLIAIPSDGTGYDDEVAVQFGRAANFVLVDAAAGDVRAVENKQVANIPQGAGIQSAQTLSNENVDVLLTANCGPKAFRVLAEAGIKVMIGAGGTVRQAVEDFKSGKLKETAAPNVDGHWM